MDADVLRSIAVKKGLMDKDAADRLSETDCFNLIFAPGFSTKTEISDVSGRGVGMDVVKTKIAQLNGTINIYSTKGKGSKIVIKVPLTLAIMPTLMVMLGNQAFAFPLVNVNEIFHLDLSRTNVVDGQEVVIVRDKALPAVLPQALAGQLGCSRRAARRPRGDPFGGHPADRLRRRSIGRPGRSGHQTAGQDAAGDPGHVGRHHYR